MLNNMFHCLGVALATIGAVVLLLAITQWLFDILIFTQTPTLLALTFVISGAAFIMVARAGQ